jgi:hypothetical protein
VTCISSLNVSGITTLQGNVGCGGIIYANGDKLNFTNTLNQYKINLWGTNNYGFGIASDTLQYSSNNYHKFYNSTNNLNTFTHAKGIELVAEI